MPLRHSPIRFLVSSFGPSPPAVQLYPPRRVVAAIALIIAVSAAFASSSDRPKARTRCSIASHPYFLIALLITVWVEYPFPFCHLFAAEFFVIPT